MVDSMGAAIVSNRPLQSTCVVMFLMGARDVLVVSLNGLMASHAILEPNQQRMCISRHIYIYIYIYIFSLDFEAGDVVCPNF